MDRRRATSLSIALVGEEPPSEFRVFTAGKVDTVKGVFVFDDAAAKSVLAEYRAHAIDLMIDYDHASLGVGVDPALSGKAAGWFNLDVREGELWAVNVRWTPPAAEALRRKEWRFMSPAFVTDADNRITSVLNVALTNLPATRRLEPLMAANALEGNGKMLDAATVKKALEAIKTGDADAAMSILEEMIAGAAGGGEPPVEDEPPAEPVEELADPAKDEDKEAVAAAISRLTRTTGKTTIGAAVEEVEVWRASHLKLEAETLKLAKERAALEMGKRKENAITLTKLGAETPATTGLSGGKLCKRLLDEPLDEQNKRVAMLLDAKGGKLPTEIKPPAGAGEAAADGSRVVTAKDGVAVTLSARELAMCAEMKIDPIDYAGRKPRKKD